MLGLSACVTLPEYGTASFPCTGLPKRGRELHVGAFEVVDPSAGSSHPAGAESSAVSLTSHQDVQLGAGTAILTQS